VHAVWLPGDDEVEYRRTSLGAVPDGVEEAGKSRGLVGDHKDMSRL
jgi:hypothetical protein